ncbi:MAG: hypothetical protein JXR39_11515 [Marinilabiliaceae bacterium]|nr:hypothetical protein [Marinilabiliaceae bacterium]
MPTEPHLTRLSTPEGFTERFWLMCQEYPTYSEAYEATERQHTAHFGKRKYSSYNSFRTVRDRVKT